MTHPAEDLRSSPRFAAIDAVFKSIARGDSANAVYALMNRTTQNLDYDERRVLPDLVAAELAKRDPESGNSIVLNAYNPLSAKR